MKLLSFSDCLVTLSGLAPVFIFMSVEDLKDFGAESVVCCIKIQQKKLFVLNDPGP